MNLDKLSNNDLYNRLQKKKKKIILYVAIIGLFMIGVNTYAWFTLQSSAEVNTTADIESFIVKFYDIDGVVKEFDSTPYSFTMKPGMTAWEKNIQVSNEGDTDADVTVGISTLSLFGNDVSFTSLSDLESKYPFRITIGTGTLTVPSGDSVNTTLQFNWPFEENAYYPLLDGFTYSSDYEYFVYDGSSYVSTTVDSTNFDDLKDSLYLFRDDLDTYLSDKCTSYMESSGESYCIKMTINLRAVQSAS